MQILLNNNKVKYIYEDKDIIDIIGEDLSEDLANIVEKKITQKTLNEITAERIAKTDCEAYEQENEGFRSSLQDISEVVTLIQIYLKDAKKLDRDKIFLWLRDIKREINNCI